MQKKKLQKMAQIKRKNGENTIEKGKKYSKNCQNMYRNEWSKGRRKKFTSSRKN